MTPRIVCDTNVIYQWAVTQGPPHGIVRAVDEGRAALHVGPGILTELRSVLNDPEVRAGVPHLTDAMVDSFVEGLRVRSAWIGLTRPRFFHSAHPKDDHIFDLAINAHADYLVTLEKRHIRMEHSHPHDFKRLRGHVPTLRIVDPVTFLRGLGA